MGPQEVAQLIGYAVLFSGGALAAGLALFALKGLIVEASDFTRLAMDRRTFEAALTKIATSPNSGPASRAVASNALNKSRLRREQRP